MGNRLYPRNRKADEDSDTGCAQVGGLQVTKLKHGLLQFALVAVQAGTFLAPMAHDYKGIVMASVALLQAILAVVNHGGSTAATPQV